MAQATLTWRDKSSNESGFIIERCQGGSCTNFVQIATVPANTTTYVDKNLVQLTTYRWRIAAFNSKGKSTYSNIVSFTTGSDQPPVTPVAPTNVIATPGDARVNLGWNSVLGAVYKGFKSTNGSPFVQVFTGLNALSYLDTSVVNGSSYDYYIIATVNNVDSVPSLTVNAIPQAHSPVPNPPPIPTGLNAVAGDAKVQLAWDFEAPAQSYNVKEGTISGGENTVASTTNNNYLRTGLVNNTKYYYKVSSVNSYGESANSSEVNATPLSGSPIPPIPPDPPPQTGPIIDILPGFDLQAAINQAAAVSGQTTIRVSTGYDFTGDFTIPSRVGGITDYVTIITSDSTGIAGGRINPSTQGNSLARIRATSGNSAVFTALSGAHHYQLIGLDCTINAPTYTPDVINFGDFTTTHDIYIDRCFIHPREISAGQLTTTLNYRTSGRGIHFNGTNLHCINSYVAGFAGYKVNSTESIDSYGIYSDVGPGPIYVDNCYFEANFNNLFWGGADTGTSNIATLVGATTTSATFSQVANLHIGDLVALFFTTPFNTTSGKSVHWGTVKVSNIVGNVVTYAGFGPSGNFVSNPDSGGTSAARWNGDNIEWHATNNTLAKRPEWLTQGFGGQWKSFNEVKSAFNSTFLNNYCVGSGYHGNAFGLTPRNQNGSSPWITINGLLIQNNYFHGVIGAPFIAGLEDNECTSTPGSNIQFGGNAQNKGNLFDGPFTNDNYNYILQLAGGTGLLVQHNTFTNTNVSNFATSGLAMENPSVNLKDNIFGAGLYGWSCFVAPGTFPTCWPGFTETNNLVVNNLGAPNIYPNSTVVADFTAVKFVDQANGNYKLANDSPGHNAASDGSDIGCDFDALPKS